jgi:hypothetical protein
LVGLILLAGCSSSPSATPDRLATRSICRVVAGMGMFYFPTAPPPGDRGFSRASAVKVEKLLTHAQLTELRDKGAALRRAIASDNETDMSAILSSVQFSVCGIPPVT